MDEFEKENEQSDEKFENVGYESTSIIMNMGSLFISFVIFLTLPALLLCLRPCRSKSRLIKDKSEKISTALKGNLFIRFFLEGCLNIAISSVLNIEHANENGGLKWDSSVNAINSVSLIFFTSVILLLPVFFLIFYCLKFKKWGKPGFEERYGAAIAGLRTDRRSSLFYPVNFILRRFALVLVAKFTQDNFFVQFMTMQAFSFAQFIYLVNCKPFTEQLLQNLELFNEVVTIILIDSLTAVSKGNEKNFDEEMDAFFLFIFFGNISVHLFFLIKSIVYSVKLKCLKKRICCYKNPKSKA